MPLDPQLAAVLDRLDPRGFPDLTRVTPGEMRALIAALRGVDGTAANVARVEERSVPGPAGALRVRIYWPPGRPPFPLLLYFHGGGFVICDLDSHDGTCRALCAASGCLVVSVDYRLAPEAPFPAAPEDCYAATRWCAAHARELGGDPTRLAVAGDSAGGNLAAVVAQQCRDRDGPRLVHQLLIYPVLDHAFDTVSYRENAEGYLLTRDLMRWFWGHYLAREADGESPLASPLRAPDLAGLAPATILTAEFDPLRDEGEAYAARLRTAGVPTSLLRYDGMIHGFFGMDGILDTARRAIEQAGEALRAAFAAAGP